MSRLRLDEPSIVFVGGKGGVGKTTTAAALATAWADAGERVLLVSTDPAHSLGDLFDRRIGPEKVELLPGVWGLEIEPDEEVESYLDSVASTMREFVRPAMYPEIERQMELSRHSPGATEAALMQRVAGLMAEGSADYDRVIFDTAPTGHTLRLLSLPEIMAAWMDGLLRSRDRSDSFGRAISRLGGGKTAGDDEAAADQRNTEEDEPEARPGDELSWFQQADESPRDKQSRRIREILLERRRLFTRARRLMLDSKKTAFLMVLIPERLPVLETRKALEALAEHRVPVAGLVVNRVIPESADGTFLASRRAQEAQYLEQIDRYFGKYPRVTVPLLQRDVQGDDALREVAASLGVGS